MASSDKTIVHRFEALVSQNKDAPVLIHDGEIISRGVIWGISAGIAKALIQIGLYDVQREAHGGHPLVVGIHFTDERRHLVISAMLGVLRTGSAFLVCDDTMSEKHLQENLSYCRFMVSEHGVETLPITINNRTSDKSNDFELKKVALNWDNIADCNQNTKIDSKEFEIEAETIACVVFTSGSTGNRKGACIEHRAIIANTDNITQLIPYSSKHDRAILFGSFSFIDSISLNIFLPLLTGVCLVILPVKLANFHTIWNAIKKYDVTRVHTIPSNLAHIIGISRGDRESAFFNRGMCNTSGEILASPLVSAFVSSFPNAQLWSTYGATEVMDVTAHQLAKGDGAQIPRPRESKTGDVMIGKVVNADLCIVNPKTLEMMPDGDEGLIAVRNEQMIQGYLRNASKTEEQFVKIPSFETTFFIAGDYGHKTTEGNLYYHGRRDQVVKIRGKKIPIVSIEASLLELSEIKEVAVVCSRQNETTEPCLIAYITPGFLDTSLIRDKLNLEDDMMPQLIIAISDFPRTSTGKKDKIALRERATALLTLNQTMVEEEGNPGGDSNVAIQVVRVWKEIFNLPLASSSVFGELGGTSLSALRIVGELAKLFLVPGSQIPPARFEHTLAQYIADVQEALTQTCQSNPHGSIESTIKVVPLNESLEIETIKLMTKLFQTMEPLAAHMDVPIEDLQGMVTEILSHEDRRSELCFVAVNEVGKVIGGTFNVTMHMSEEEDGATKDSAALEIIGTFLGQMESNYIRSSEEHVKLVEEGKVVNALASFVDASATNNALAVLKELDKVSLEAMKSAGFTRVFGICTNFVTQYLCLECQNFKEVERVQAKDWSLPDGSSPFQGLGAFPIVSCELALDE
eukprot:m.140063 g.140063  ORF g.140063 m.140063 type:complete len:859 (-) comp14817_c2_seq3:103-2679(-)